MYQRHHPSGCDRTTADCAGPLLGSFVPHPPDAQKIACRPLAAARHTTGPACLTCVAVGSKTAAGAVPRRRRVDVDGLRIKKPRHPPAVDVACTVTPQQPLDEDYVAGPKRSIRRIRPVSRACWKSQLPNEGEAPRSANCCSSSTAALIARPARRAGASQAALVQSQRDLARHRCPIDAVSQQERTRVAKIDDPTGLVEPAGRVRTAG